VVTQHQARQLCRCGNIHDDDTIDPVIRMLRFRQEWNREQAIRLRAGLRARAQFDTYARVQD